MVQYGSPPPSDLDDTISDEEDCAYEYVSEAESQLASEEWPSDSETERKELGVAGPRDSDEENQYRPDGLEPADLDSRYNDLRHMIRQIMYAVRRYKKGRTGYASFEQLWEAWGRIDFLPSGYDEEDFVEDFNDGDAWWITKGELQQLIDLARAEDYDVPSMWSGGLGKWKEAVAFAPEELPDRREIDPNDLPACHARWYYR